MTQDAWLKKVHDAIRAKNPNTDVTLAQLKACNTAIWETATTVVAEEKTMQIQGFGTLTVKEQGERQGRNPRTGEAITIAPKRTVGFTPHKRFMDALTEA